MSLANRVTLARIGLIPVFLVLTIPNTTWTRVAASIIFVLACATDPLDGYLARSRREITDLGAILDPLADKLLMMTAFVVLVKYQTVAAWMAVVVIARELIVTSLRVIVAQKRATVVHANRWGKAKTLIQMVGVSILLFMAPFGHDDVYIRRHMPIVSNLIMAAILFATIVSGYKYLFAFKDLLMETPKTTDDESA